MQPETILADGLAVPTAPTARLAGRHAPGRGRRWR